MTALLSVDLDALIYLAVIVLGLTGFGVVAWFAAAFDPLDVEPERHGDLLLWETEPGRFDVTCALGCEALFVDFADLDAARAFILANLEGVPGHYCEDDPEQRRLDAMADGAAQARDEAEGERWWAA